MFCKIYKIMNGKISYNSQINSSFISNLLLVLLLYIWRNNEPSRVELASSNQSLIVRTCILSIHPIVVVHFINRPPRRRQNNATAVWSSCYYKSLDQQQSLLCTSCQKITWFNQEICTIVHKKLISD